MTYIAYTLAMLYWLLTGGPPPATVDIPTPPDPPAVSAPGRMSVCDHAPL